MTTLVYVHLGSGIRCEYHVHESYFGDYEEFKLGNIFVITLKNDKLDILDCNFEKKYVVTEKGNINFKQLKLTIDSTD